MRKMLFTRLRHDRRGMGFIEMALATPLLALLFLGMVDLSKIVAANIDLEQAAQRTTDYALARRPASASTTYLETEAANASGQSSSNIRVELFLECDGTKQTSFTGSCASGSTTHRFVSVEIDRQVDTGFNWRGMAAIFAGGNGSYRPVTVTGDSVVRIQ